MKQFLMKKVEKLVEEEKIEIPQQQDDSAMKQFLMKKVDVLVEEVTIDDTPQG